MEKSNISVIVPTYNEEKTILRCLEALGEQALKPKEIIIVDDGSTDGTEREILRFAQNDQRVKIFKQHHKGPGTARNLGASKATGDILVFVDADMRFSPTFLDELTTPIREGKSKGTFSKEEYVSNWTNRWARFWNYRKGLFDLRAIPADYPNRAPVFRAILKSEFEKAGGFDESRGYDDDWSLSERLGYRATAIKAMYYHDNPDSLRDVFLQARWATKRRGKFGVFGVLGRLVKAIPIWATPVFIWRIVVRGSWIMDTMRERIFGGLLFSLAAQTGEIIGILEQIVSKNLMK